MKSFRELGLVLLALLVGIVIGYVPGCGTTDTQSTVSNLKGIVDTTNSTLTAVAATNPALTTAPAIKSTEKVLTTTSQVLGQAQPIAQSVDVVTNPSSTDQQKLAAISQAVESGAQIGAAAAPQYSTLIELGGGLAATLITAVGGLILAHKSANNAVNQAHATAQVALASTTTTTTTPTTPTPVTPTTPPTK